VLAWYERGREAGTRAQVSETTVVGDQILVGLVVSNAGDAAGLGGQATRWQVLTVIDGRVADIVGFEQRSEAAAWIERSAAEP
jgi:hypothetical protein